MCAFFAALRRRRCTTTIFGIFLHSGLSIVFPTLYCFFFRFFFFLFSFVFSVAPDIKQYTSSARAFSGTRLLQTCVERVGGQGEKERERERVCVWQSPGTGHWHEINVTEKEWGYTDDYQ